MDTPAEDLSPAHRLATGSAWMLGSKLLGGVIGVFVSALLARLLAPGELGAFFLAQSVVGFAAIVALFGMGLAVTRLIPEALAVNQPGRARQVIIRAASMASAGVVIVGVALFAGWHSLSIDLFHSEPLSQLSSLVAAWLLTIAALNLTAGIFKGMQAMHLAALFEGLLANVLSGAFLLILWLAEGRVSLGTVAAARIAAGGLALGVASAFIVRRTRLLKGPGRAGARELATVGWPLMTTQLLPTLVGTTSDLWILAAFVSKGEVAKYGAAIRLVLPITIAFTAFTSAAAPIIAEMNKKGRRPELERLIRASTGILTVPSLLALAALALFGGAILGALFGPFYSSAGAILSILSLGRCVWVFNGPAGTVLMMTGHHRTAMTLVLVGGMVSVAGDLWAAPRFGAVGVATATSVGVILSSTMGMLAARRYLGIWTFARLSRRDLRKGVETLRGLKG